MKRSRLKNKANISNRSKDHVDIANYKKQRNLNFSLNRLAKSEYFRLADILRLCPLKMIKCY